MTPHICRVMSGVSSIWEAAWDTDSSACLSTLCLNAAARGGSFQTTSTSPSSHSFLKELQIAQRYGRLLTWPMRMIVLPHYFSWLSSGSLAPLLSACWSPYPRPTPTLGPCQGCSPAWDTFSPDIFVMTPFPSLVSLLECYLSWWVSREQPIVQSPH